MLGRMAGWGDKGGGGKRGIECKIDIPWVGLRATCRSMNDHLNISARKTCLSMQHCQIFLFNAQIFFSS